MKAIVLNRYGSADDLELTDVAKPTPYTQEDFTQNKRRYDLILDTKTNRSIFKYLRVLNPHGTYVTVGGSTARLFQALFLGPIVRLFSKKRVCLVNLKPNKDLDYINGHFFRDKFD